MNRIDKLKKALIGSCLLAAGLGGQAWAQVPCSSSTDGDDLSIGVVGGSASCEAWGMSGCFVRNPGGSCTAVDADGNPTFKVTTAPVNNEGEVSWSIEYLGDNTKEGLGAIDVSVWEGAKKGQNYPFLFRYDVGAPDTVSMTCNNGATAGIHFCMDETPEFLPILENPGQPTVGNACNTDPDAVETLATIYGVKIDVSGVPAGQGLTTITVARSDQRCTTDELSVAPDLPLCRDLNNSTGWETDPAFGFVEAGQITLKNICLAEANQFVTEDQCDPDKDVVNGPFIDSLNECPKRLEDIVREEVSVGYEGSGYVGYGGSRRYY